MQMIYFVVSGETGSQGFASPPRGLCRRVWSRKISSKDGIGKSISNRDLVVEQKSLENIVNCLLKFEMLKC